MLARLLSQKANILWGVLSLIGVLIVGYMLVTGNPAVDWIVELEESLWSSRRPLKSCLLIAIFPVCAVTFIPALLYDMLTRQGKFER